MTDEPDAERSARRDVRTVEIARILGLLSVVAVGLVLLSGSGLRAGADVPTALVALCTATALALAIRRIVHVRRSGL